MTLGNFYNFKRNLHEFLKTWSLENSFRVLIYKEMMIILRLFFQMNYTKTSSFRNAYKVRLN